MELNMNKQYAINNDNTRAAVEQAYGFDKQYGTMSGIGVEDFIEYEVYVTEDKSATYFFVNDKLVGYKPWE